ncbi:hypothetical protein [Kribbella sp. VKM Ac-2568]|uniref:hypothetical protein n=1 Tax=Kribbella sp. VKM Ac-2568 TaxID=2512219 RepID=UPI00105080B2|nr:hypothetical protein [Kribbella sp. VKM Ac-2568]
MTAAEETFQPTAPACWCCGGEFDERDLVRLGTHPEVGVCLGCARYLQRRAAEREDELRISPAARLRVGVRGAREWVISRGWHRLPVVGTVLQRIDRHLP